MRTTKGWSPECRSARTSAQAQNGPTRSTAPRRCSSGGHLVLEHEEAATRGAGEFATVDPMSLKTWMQLRSGSSGL